MELSKPELDAMPHSIGYVTAIHFPCSLPLPLW
jgi:hypothetical protein